MSASLAAYEPYIRFAIFAGVLVIMALWEFRSPRRIRTLTRSLRWTNNFAVVFIDMLLVRLVFPVTAVGLAILCQTKGWGLFNLWPMSAWLTVPAAIVLLDLIIYGQHVMFHAVPVLWRFHRMHHADLEFDVTTGVRFHPGEIILSMLIKLAAVAALGIPPLAVVLFEVLLNATSMFNHGNVRLPKHIDRLLRYVLVTPDMHRVHHSTIRREANSNFGFNLPWWDYLFGTYRAQPEAGHENMTIGVAQIRDPAEQRIDKMLTQPVRYPVRSYKSGNQADTVSDETSG